MANASNLTDEEIWNTICDQVSMVLEYGTEREHNDAAKWCRLILRGSSWSDTLLAAAVKEEFVEQRELLDFHQSPSRVLLRLRAPAMTVYPKHSQAWGLRELPPELIDYIAELIEPTFNGLVFANNFGAQSTWRFAAYTPDTPIDRIIVPHPYYDDGHIPHPIGELTGLLYALPNCCAGRQIPDMFFRHKLVFPDLDQATKFLSRPPRPIRVTPVREPRRIPKPGRIYTPRRVHRRDTVVDRRSLVTNIAAKPVPNPRHTLGLPFYDSFEFMFDICDTPIVSSQDQHKRQFVFKIHDEVAPHYEYLGVCVRDESTQVMTVHFDKDPFFIGSPRGIKPSDRLPLAEHDNTIFAADAYTDFIKDKEGTYPIPSSLPARNRRWSKIKMLSIDQASQNLPLYQEEATRITRANSDDVWVCVAKMPLRFDTGCGEDYIFHDGASTLGADKEAHVRGSGEGVWSYSPGYRSRSD
ncbi:hypothetical protein LTR17_023446 [Elasticomyces elasticus]|nr:hypothetical protein LTR17_023446 [Elasticomyces elasticus]